MRTLRTVCELKKDYILGIGNRIKSIRGSLTQKEMAKKISVHIATYQLYEQGNIPKGDVLQRIHEAFGVSIDWLLTGKGKPYLYCGIDGEPLTDAVKVIREYEAKDQDGLYGKSSQVEVDGKLFDVTEFTPEEKHPPDGVGLGRAVDLLANVMRSGNEVYVRAILANLKAFSDAVDNQSEAADRIEILELKCDKYEKVIAELEARVAALEVQIKSSDPPEPGGGRELIKSSTT